MDGANVTVLPMAKELIMKLIRTLLILLVVSIYFTACSDPTAVGAELLQDDRADIGYTDTFTVQAAYTVLGKPQKIYSGFSSGRNLTNYLLGNFNDPVFGRSQSILNLQLLSFSGSPGFINNNSIDSAILLLPYSFLTDYGIVDETYGFDVHQLDEILDEDESYYSDYEAMFMPGTIGTFSAVPNTDTTAFIRYNGTEADTINIPHLRVPIELSVIDEFLTQYEQDSTFFSNDSLFLANFSGIQLRPTTENSGLLSFDFFNSDVAAVVAGLYVFYQDTASEVRSSQFIFSSQETARFPQYQHDYSGSLAEPYIRDLSADDPDSLLFVQGMSGTEVRVQLPEMEEIKGFAINKAELEFYVREFPDDSNYAPVNILAAATKDSDESLIVIDDLQIPLDRGLSVGAVYGGTPIKQNDGTQKYIINVTEHLQQVLDGEIDNEITLIPFGKISNAQRIVLYGANHPDYSIQLRVTYTRL